MSHLKEPVFTQSYLQYRYLSFHTGASTEKQLRPKKPHCRISQKCQEYLQPQLFHIAYILIKTTK